ncbi:hypothetical protein OXX80_008301 [Metschnikowia pulcherrima]
MLTKVAFIYMLAACYAAICKTMSESADQEVNTQPLYHGIDLGPFDRYFKAKRADSGWENDLYSFQHHPSFLKGEKSDNTNIASMNTESGIHKRSEVAIRAYWRANGRVVRIFNVWADGNCTNLESAANVLHWNVSGPSCRFVIFKDQYCMGPVVHRTKGFTVFNDGVKETPSFGSVRFECRDLT